MFRNSASFSQLVLEKERFLLSTKEYSKVETVLVLAPALSYQAYSRPKTQLLRAFCGHAQLLVVKFSESSRKVS